jgi:hypothetical protein
MRAPSPVAAALPLGRGLLVALALGAFALAGSQAACGNTYTALPGIAEEPLDCITFSVFDLQDRGFCRTSGTIDDNCDGANGHSKVVVDRVARTVTGTAFNDPKVEASGLPAVNGEAYAVFDLPQSPRKVILDHTFRVDEKSASKMAFTPGCSLEWVSGKIQDNLDLNIGRDNLSGIYYYRGSIPNDGSFLTGLPFPTTRSGTFTGLLEAYASARATRIATKVTEGSTVYLDVSKIGPPVSGQGALTMFDPVTFTIYCGMSVQDGDGTLMKATGTSIDPKVTACYPKGTAPAKPVYVPPADAGVDAAVTPDSGTADAGPKDAGADGG